MSVPGSKSLTNRALVAAAVAGGGTVLDPLDCEDTRLLAAALASAGWVVGWDGAEIRVGGRTVPDRQPVRVDLGNSGTGARLMVALLACVDGRSIVDGTARLRERPVEPLVVALKSLGASVSCRKGRFPVSIDGGRLAGGVVKIRPQVSSQFVTALLMMAPLCTHGLEIEVEGELPSAPYLGLTADVLRGFGGGVEHSRYLRHWKVAGRPLVEATWLVEGDWSAAAFPLAAVAVAGGQVDIGPLNPQSRQGDRIVCDVLEASGVTIVWRENRLIASGPAAGAIRADLSSCPDAFPALAAVAGCCLPGSRLTGLGNLIHKESNRLAVMAQNLADLGAELEVEGGEFRVAGTVRAGGGRTRAVRSAADHRIGMAMAVAALRAGPLLIDDPGCVGKSFPDFWNRWQALLATALGDNR